MQYDSCRVNDGVSWLPSIGKLRDVVRHHIEATRHPFTISSTRMSWIRRSQDIDGTCGRGQTDQVRPCDGASFGSSRIQTL